ncbi:MAG: putative transposase, partial [Thermovirga sp.]|nr:putative transposase [Thermovirga sp.]
MSIRCIQKTSSNLKYFPHNIATVKSYILCKFVLVSGNGLMHFSYFLLKAIDFRA